MRIVFPALAVLLLLATSCRKHTPHPPLKDTIGEILAADSAFSALSEEKGTAYAFHAYMAEDGRTLPMKGHPRTRSYYEQRLTEAAEGEGTLTWTPLHADAAASGELGYSYGKYQYTALSEEGDSLRAEGYYVTVWKRGADQEWKFVFDAGNQLDEETR